MFKDNTKMIESVPKNAYFLPEDLTYFCKCGVQLRYNSGLGFAIAVKSGDSSAESIMSLEQHICIQEDHKHLSDSYLNSQQNEIETQKQVYGGFHSLGQTPPIQHATLGKQRVIRTEEHNKQIGQSVHSAIQKKAESQNLQKFNEALTEIEKRHLLANDTKWTKGPGSGHWRKAETKGKQ